MLLGNGDGTFQAKDDYATGTGPRGSPSATSTATASRTWRWPTNDNTVSVLLGNGDGTFTATSDYATGSNPYAVAVGDFNGDGKQDLAVADYGANTVSVLLGDGDGTFQCQGRLRDRRRARLLSPSATSTATASRTW